MRGEGSPSPIYEGEDSVIAWMLDGKTAHYQVPLPAPGEAKRAILDTYTKEHSAEYQSQALIDLAFRMGRKITDWDSVEDVLIETSHHTHYVIGTGSNDPQKFDPSASRETLDHSIMYIVAVALQDGEWHHVRSYAPERANRADTVRLWQKIRTVEDPRWTERYHTSDPDTKAFGGRIVIDHERRQHHRRRNGGRQRPYARGHAMATPGLYTQVPHADRRRHRRRGSRALPGHRRTAGNPHARRTGTAKPGASTSHCSPPLRLGCSSTAQMCKSFLVLFFKKEQRKRFFFEKKKQKTFGN